MEKKVAIVLINYKDYAKRFLAECRDSLRTQTYTSFQVYIVDNASSKESYDYLKTEYKEAKILTRKDGNYSAANNLGIKEAIKDGFEYFVVANMDTKFDKDWLKELVEASQGDDVGIVQSKILLYNRDKDGKRRINSLGNHLHFLGFGFTDGYMEEDYKIEGLKEIKGYASGCSFLIKKEVFEKIGGYNEEYYMYHDDVEVSLKTRLAGYKIMLAPKSIVYHKYEFSRSIEMIYYMERNRYITIFSFFKLRTLLFIIIPSLLFEIGMMFFSIINGWFKEWLRVEMYFMRHKSWKKIRENRKKIKAIRKISDRQLVSNIVGKIEFLEISNPILKYIVNPIFNIYWQVVKKIIIW